jgi:hypothetical protein
LALGFHDPTNGTKAPPAPTAATAEVERTKNFLRPTLALSSDKFRFLTYQIEAGDCFGKSIFSAKYNILTADSVLDQRWQGNQRSVPALSNCEET